jgi:ABC-2 type transport system permease protein
MDKKIFIVAKREYLERVRTRWFIAMTLLVPAVITGFVMLTAYIGTRGNASSEVRHITIINATDSDLGMRVANALAADTTLSSTSADSIHPRVLNVAPGDLAVTEKQVASEVQLPNHIAGYLVLSDSTLAGKSVRYSGRNASSLSDMDKLQTTVRDAVMMIRLQREGVKPDIISDMTRTHLRLNSERLNERGRSGSGTAGVFAGLVVGVMLLMLIVIHGQNILRGVLEEKSTRVAEVVISSVKPETLLAGKVLGVGGVGLTQQIAWFAITGYLVSFLMPIVLKGVSHSAAAAGGAAAASPINGVLSSMSPMILGVAVAYFIVGFVFYATLYAAAGSMVNSEQEAQQAAAPVMVLIMSAWLCVNPVMLAPSGKLAVALSWLPWSSPIIMPIRMGLTSVSALEVAGSILVAVIGSVFSIWLSARIYRVGMLMYGKKPSFSEVAKWIRYA